MLSLTNLTKTWRSVRANPKLMTYDLHAECNSLRMNSGRAQAIVAAEMGHSIKVLFERYLGSANNAASDGVKAVEELLG